MIRKQQFPHDLVHSCSFCYLDCKPPSVAHQSSQARCAAAAGMTPRLGAELEWNIHDSIAYTTWPETLCRFLSVIEEILRSPDGISKNLPAAQNTPSRIKATRFRSSAVLMRSHELWLLSWRRRRARPTGLEHIPGREESMRRIRRAHQRGGQRAPSSPAPPARPGEPRIPSPSSRR